MLLPAVLLLSFTGLAHGFHVQFAEDGTSTTHRDITIRAVLQKTAEVCKDIAASEGRDFSLTINNNLTPMIVQTACLPLSSSAVSTVMFHTALSSMTFSNAMVDWALMASEERHFNDETIQGGRDLITAGMAAAKASVRKENFISGRSILGEAYHTLQDFYSHSNWVELGKTSPYSNLIQPDEPLDGVAGPDVHTCRDCTENGCDDNILPDLLQQGLITSGYFNLFNSEKPPGKCSHGGSFDKTSERDPVGGISKDDIGSSHGSLHTKAADLAVSATLELLEDVRLAMGDKKFLQLMGLSQSSVLCFVIDTTGSMTEDIAEAKRVSFNIIDSKKGTPQEPAAYIMVPFNDPGFGPVMMTTDSDIFKANMNGLTASGGDDIPEMCLSALRLALTAAPPYSEIFVFTDAGAKDDTLGSIIKSLIESTNSVVNFILTDAGIRRRRDSHGLAPRNVEFEVYRDLAQSAGGLAIEVTKAELPHATSLIVDSLATAVVTLLQAVKSTGGPETFLFIVDGSLQNTRVYITGTSLTFVLTSPSGDSQSSTVASTDLAVITTEGNLWRLSLNAGSQTGLWQISVDSTNPYSVKVTGQSSVDFIVNHVEEFGGSHVGLSLKNGRPFTGGNAVFMITVTGSDTVKVTEASLYDGVTPTLVSGTLKSLGGSTFLAWFNNLPSGDYVLRLVGEDSSSRAASSLQRQASTRIITSTISVTPSLKNTNIEPGSTISIPFTAAFLSNGFVDGSFNGQFNVRATNDRNFLLTAPTQVTATDGIASGVITVTAPSSAVSGSDVTVTIEAADTDFNYAVVRLSITAKTTDMNRPVCHEVSRAICASTSCSSSQWEFVANITDGINGTGIESVKIYRGNGTLNTSSVSGAGGENITVATYSASCCLQDVQLVVVDKVGNVGFCVGQAIAMTPAAPTTTAALNTAENTLSTQYFLWGSLVVSMLLK